MRTTQIKKQLHNYIDIADDKKLKAIYTLIEGDITYNGYMTKDQMEEFDRRMADHEKGIGRTYTWEETLDIVQGTNR